MEDGVAVFYHLSIDDRLASGVSHILYFLDGDEDDVIRLLWCPVDVFNCPPVR